MALDSRNRPHIVFYANDTRGIPQYQHLRFDGDMWHHQIFSSRTDTFSLQGKGTLQIPISRPEIVIDRQDNPYVIYRGDLTEDHMTVTRLSTLNNEESRQLQATTALWNKPLGFAEPVIDRTRWSTVQVLTLLLQYNQQPNGDREHGQRSAPISLVDYRIQ
jgi:hypothetical protein